MHIISIQIGLPQTHHSPDPNLREQAKTDPNRDHSWQSGIFKSSITGPRFLGKTNLDGDGQADLKNHGGPDKAVCVYAHEHYDYWQQQFTLPELSLGAFGENFTTQGLLESAVCIGDTFAIGDFVGGNSAEGNLGGDTPGDGKATHAIVQLSQPRQPCWKLARRWQIGDLAVQVQDTGFTGWYFRVLQEGIVQPGDRLQLIERPYPHLTVAEANRIMHHDKEDWATIAQFLQCPALSTSWQNSLRKRINARASSDVSDRLYGNN